MQINPQIAIQQARKVVGFASDMSFAEDKTAALWRELMPRRAEIKLAVSHCLISMSQYSKDFDFAPTTPFKKWAAVEVSAHQDIPQAMRAETIEQGLYAQFHYIGSSRDSLALFRYIFTEWLPQSGYQLDNSRPHFEVLGVNYRPDDPLAQEDIYIPIK